LPGAPRAPENPFANFRAMEALKHWDRERGFVPTSSKAPLADLYVCWNPGALFVGLYTFDSVETIYYSDGAIPEVDRALWSVQIDGADVVTARIGGGRPPAVSGPPARVECLSGLDRQVRLIAFMQIPAERFGKARLAAGDAIDLRSSLVTHGRAYEYQWTAKLPLAD
jgi:hypothetical protein